MTSYLGNTAKSLEMVPSMFGMLVEITAQLMDIADRKLTPAVIQVLFVESDLHCVQNTFQTALAETYQVASDTERFQRIAQKLNPAPEQSIRRIAAFSKA